MGWPARAYGNPNSTDILHIPLAVSAGLGQLGKHGSMISKEFGSNFRLAAVLTNLPLALDEPEDIGVDDLCIGCQRCTIDCPADAINNEKQLVRGKQKWYVDFDKCIPYFVKTHGCAICIEVCPWSVPGRAPPCRRNCWPSAVAECTFESVFAHFLLRSPHRLSTVASTVRKR